MEKRRFDKRIQGSDLDFCGYRQEEKRIIPCQRQAKVVNIYSLYTLQKLH